MPENKLMVLDKIEDLLDDDNNIIGKLVTDKAGNHLKVKKGLGGKLEAKWEALQVGRAYSFTMGLYKDKYPFVADLEEVKDIMKKKAIEEVQQQIGDSKNRAFSLSYSKDYHIARMGQGTKVTEADILVTAKLFESYLDTGLTVEQKPKIEKENEVCFNQDWWKENLEKTNYKEWLPETFKQLHIEPKQDLLGNLKTIEPSKLALIENEVKIRLKEVS